ncbi:hypothetical protein ILUMI_17276 [Ignelater luminosus]|uniref:DUF7869 domain-containing protein n=1 Tax=Ignelater luminosus TaxID=2038154 RepID=A0A8K0G571_IGNLU|nr:hypothetical protein ILUMI_17276 [Ignelater luminosus]
MLSSSSESDDESDVNSRKWIKRIRNPELYKRNIIRNCKVSGKKHTNWKGKIVVERTGNLCRQSENGAETNVDNKQKFSTYKYFLVIDNTRIEICKKTFIAVHGVTERRVYRICNLLRQGTAPHDKRGENRSGNAAEVLLRIHEHIKSYPTHISHYSGKEKKYLDAILYEMFKTKHPVQELCKSRDDVVGLCVDFMSNLPLPPVKEIFYFHQLWVHTFGVYNLKTDNSHMYMYHDGIARQSPDEVGSLLRDYIEKNIPGDFKELYLFSDNCGGQNKNHTVLRFLAALTDSGRFDKIHHCLPLRGHSFLPCNRDFSRVKRVIRKADQIFSPDEYAQMIKQACKRADNFFAKQKVYDKEIPINKKEIEDIEKVKQDVTDVYKTFYKKILIWPTKDDGDVDSEIDILKD